MNSITTAPAVAVAPTGDAAAKQAGNQALMIIAVFKLLKALLFFAVAFGLLRMIHKDTAVELRKLVHVFRIDSDRAFIQTLLTKATDIQDQQKLFGGIAAAFSGLMFCIEGIGLLLRRKWAEYFTIILTSCGIPIELYEVFHRTSHEAHQQVIDLVPEAQRAAFVFDKMMLLKIGALLLNALIVWFLVAHLRRARRGELALASATAAAGHGGTNAGVSP